MQNLILFISTLICWAPTWYLIKFQFGVVDPLISIFYRFFLASVIIFIFLIISQKKLRFTFNQHLLFLLLGMTLFSLNYIFFYLANTYLISGIVTIAFSTILIMNILGERVFFKIKSSKQTLWAAGFGILGIIIIFQKELFNFTMTESSHIGILLSFVATFWASSGNLIYQKNSSNKVPLSSPLPTACCMDHLALYLLLKLEVQNLFLIILSLILALYYI
jgi:hypothetical protein